jgi:hypothetical protein
MLRGKRAPPFSTVDANGIKVAGNDEGARTSSISLIVKAGSRYAVACRRAIRGQFISPRVASLCPEV